MARIEELEAPGEAHRQAVADILQHHHARHGHAADRHHLALLLMDDERIAGGLFGNSMYGWLQYPQS
jgi:hypothetical protein